MNGIKIIIYMIFINSSAVFSALFKKIWTVYIILFQKFTKLYFHCDLNQIEPSPKSKSSIIESYRPTTEASVSVLDFHHYEGGRISIMTTASFHSSPSTTATTRTRHQKIQLQLIRADGGNKVLNTV